MPYPGETGTRFAMTSDQRFEILKTELSLIQSTLDKYDDLIFRGRNFFITLWIASLSLAFTIKSASVPLLAAALSAIYWFLEGMMRHQYAVKYVHRYRFLRDEINKAGFDPDSIDVYDLTNHHKRKKEPIPRLERIRSSFLKAEPAVLYTVMALAALGAWQLLRTGLLGA